LEADDMKAFLFALAMSASLSATAIAQTPVTATCKDGTTFSGTKRSGAVHGYGGVQTWGTDAGTSSSAPGTTPAPAGGPSPTAPTKSPAPGGGPGQVWVNTANHVYHRPGTQWYGTTKKGKYMDEAAAKAAGNHAGHGKACS